MRSCSHGCAHNSGSLPDRSSGHPCLQAGSPCDSSGKMPELLRRRRRCVVVNDAPSFRQALENEREAAMRLVGFSLQRPTTKHNCCVRREYCDFKIGEGERPHLCPVRIFFAVPLTDCVPTVPDLVPRNKNSRCRSRVAVHKFVDVAAVPRVLLCAKHRLNFRGCVRRVLRGCANNGRSQNTTINGHRVGESFVSGKREYRLQR